MFSSGPFRERCGFSTHLGMGKIMSMQTGCGNAAGRTRPKSSILLFCTAPDHLWRMFLLNLEIAEDSGATSECLQPTKPPPRPPNKLTGTIITDNIYYNATDRKRAYTLFARGTPRIFQVDLGPRRFPLCSSINVWAFSYSFDIFCCTIELARTSTTRTLPSLTTHDGNNEASLAGL